MHLLWKRCCPEIFEHCGGANELINISLCITFMGRTLDISATSYQEYSNAASMVTGLHSKSPELTPSALIN